MLQDSGLGKILSTQQLNLLAARTALTVRFSMDTLYYITLH